MDTVSAVVLASGVVANRELIVKLLGPTADYLGEGIKNNVQKVDENISRIFNHSIKLLGSKIETEGEVSPRILKQIINEGGFCEDELTSEYFGGVLASSRSDDLKDDRGLAYLSVVSSMSTYQIKTHYILYSIIKKLYGGASLSCSRSEDNRKMRVFIPWDFYLKCMNSDKSLNYKFSHIFFGLSRLDLIGPWFSYGDKKSLSKSYPAVSSEGILLEPSALGAELYLWVHGHSDTPLNNFLHEEIQFPTSEILSIPDGAIAIDK